MSRYGTLFLGFATHCTYDCLSSQYAARSVTKAIHPLFQQRRLCSPTCVACVSRQSSFGRYQQKHVLLPNTLTCLSFLVDINPNVNPPLKPGQHYLVDGGFSTQLSKYLGSETVDGDPLWTARSLIDSPDTVCRVHRDFLASR